jgi:hypothetical protein
MTKITLTLLMCSAINGLSAMGNKITVPDQQELKNRLDKLGLHHFVEKTHIDKTLGSTNRYPHEIVAVIDLALLQYNETSLSTFEHDIQRNIANQFMQMKKPKMIEAILQEHPDAIAFLKERSISNK